MTKNWEETDYTSVVPTILIAATKKEFLQNLEKEFSKTHFSKANSGVKLTSLSNIKQQSASREQMKVYNSWAKKMNKQIELAIKTENSNSPKPYPIIKIKDVEKYKYIYSIMSDKQRKDAEPFPNLPEPPPPPPISANAGKERIVKYQKSIDKYNSEKKKNVYYKLKSAKTAAIFAVISAINLPIIKFSVELWTTLHQKSSVFRMDGVKIDPTMLTPLILMFFLIVLFI